MIDRIQTILPHQYVSCTFVMCMSFMHANRVSHMYEALCTHPQEDAHSRVCKKKLYCTEITGAQKKQDTPSATSEEMLGGRLSPYSSPEVYMGVLLYMEHSCCIQWSSVVYMHLLLLTGVSWPGGGACAVLAEAAKKFLGLQ